MSAGWVAAAVRGRGLARRRLGPDGARELARCPGLPAALAVLAATPYGRDVRAGMDLSAAQHAAGSTCLWHLRILAGWAPALASGALRILAGRFEIANVASHPAFGPAPVTSPYALGSLATAWPAVSAAATPAGIRAALAASAWGDPGCEDGPSVRLALELAWARRVAGGVPAGSGWAAGWAAVVVARAVEAGRAPDPTSPAGRDATAVLGARWASASPAAGEALPTPGAAGLAAVVPPAAARVLGGAAGEPWRAEARWWAGLAADAEALLARPRPGEEAAVGAAAALVADAWMVGAALSVAAGGGGDLDEAVGAAA